MTAKITLTWDNGSSEHVDQIVYRSAETFTVDNLPPVLARAGRNAREYIDTDIVTGNTYFYAVASENVVGEILLSSVISVTVGASTGDPHWGNVVSLLHFGGVEGSTTFTDDTGTLWERQGNATITTAVPGPFGGACAAFPGYGRILSGVAEKLALGTEDFTLECFVRRTTVGGIFDNRFGSFGSPLPISVPNSRTDMAFRDTLPGTLRTSSLLASDWYHYALVRDGGTVRQYLSGIQQDGEYTSLDSYTNTQVCIGAAYPGPGVAAFTGYIAEFRITKGVARYTSNFTPPTEPFPNF